MMRLTLFFLFSILIISCSYEPINKVGHTNFYGSFYPEGYTMTLEFHQDSSFVLLNPSGNGHLSVPMCDYASKGKWKMVDNNLIEIVSEDNYKKQDGFKYELLKERKYSDDSLYLNVSLSADFYYPLIQWGFNYEPFKIIKTKDTTIIISKKEYLWNPEKIDRNLLQFCIERESDGAVYYNNRMHFDIFEQEINTNEYNYITIRLPYFDQCFFDFESYNEDYIRIINNGELRWRGMSWVRKK